MEIGAAKVNMEQLEGEGKEADDVCCDAEDTTDDAIPVLLCMRCRSPLCRCDDILQHRATDAWTSQVYAYELDLFVERPPLWCYSATNPSTRRFDLVRCSPAIVTRDHTVHISGGWSAEHSFFVGHEWCMSECKICGNFLGWGFRQVLDEAEKTQTNSDDEGEEGEEGDENNNKKKKKKKNENTEAGKHLSFIGLILTHCIGKDDYPRAEYEKIIRLGAWQQ